MPTLSFHPYSPGLKQRAYYPLVDIWLVAWQHPIQTHCCCWQSKFLTKGKGVSHINKSENLHKAPMFLPNTSVQLYFFFSLTVLHENMLLFGPAADRWRSVWVNMAKIQQINIVFIAEWWVCQWARDYEGKQMMSIWECRILSGRKFALSFHSSGSSGGVTIDI